MNFLQNNMQTLTGGSNPFFGVVAELDQGFNHRALPFRETLKRNVTRGFHFGLDRTRVVTRSLICSPLPRKSVRASEPLPVSNRDVRSSTGLESFTAKHGA